jgi:hypothetical protein
VPGLIRADLIQANGYGTFGCGANIPHGATGYGAEDQVSFVAQDAQGNPIDATIFLDTLSAVACTPGVPVLYGQQGPRDQAAFSKVTATWDYLGHDYNTSKGICSDAQGDWCGVTMGIDETGELTVKLSMQLPGEDRLNQTTLEMGGPITVTSQAYGTYPVYFGPFFLGDYSYASGTFTVGDVPEPAEWSLLLAALPILIFRYRKSIKQKLSASVAGI